MKRNFLRMAANYSLLVMLGLVTFTSACKKDDVDDDDNDTTDVVLVEDGMYLSGAGTGIAALDPKGLFKNTPNEADANAERTSLYGMYIAVKGGTGFNVSVKAGATTTTYGPDADFVEVAEADRHQDEPKGFFMKGSYKETDAKFTVTEDGLYHVVLDTELKKIAVARADWGLIGGATPGGWGENTPMTATFDMNKMTFSINEVTMLQNDWKFRYSNGWKIFLSATDAAAPVAANTNFGGTLTALTPGGANISNAKYGVYKYTLTWELNKDFVATEEFVKDAEALPTYPDAMYLVGDATAYGWGDPGTVDAAIMHKCAGGAPSEGIFWKIAYLETGKGFKVSAAAWKAPNLGFGDVTDGFDPNGVTVSDAGGNMGIAESGMYMIVVNLRDDMIKVSVTPAAVYGIGDAFGGWDEAMAATKFTVDNTAKTLKSPATVAAGNIRMYVEHAWIAAWWNSEFNVYGGVIEYRNDGGDQAAVAGTVGQTVTLKFDDNTGSIQ